MPMHFPPHFTGLLFLPRLYAKYSDALPHPSDAPVPLDRHPRDEELRSPFPFLCFQILFHPLCSAALYSATGITRSLLAKFSPLHTPVSTHLI